MSGVAVAASAALCKGAAVQHEQHDSASELSFPWHVQEHGLLDQGWAASLMASLSSCRGITLCSMSSACCCYGLAFMGECCSMMQLPAILCTA